MLTYQKRAIYDPLESIGLHSIDVCLTHVQNDLRRILSSTIELVQAEDSILHQLLPRGMWRLMQRLDKSSLRLSSSTEHPGRAFDLIHGTRRQGRDLLASTWPLRSTARPKIQDTTFEAPHM